MGINDQIPSGENVAFRRIRVGPADMGVPGDWRVTNDGSDGIVVLHLPLGDDDDDLVQRPGFVQPNLVLSYTERSALDGGVAAVTAESFRGTRERFPGATLLDVTPFVSEGGLPGRRQLVVGLEQRVPFEQLLWHVGVGGTVVEVVLTLPAGAPESFRALGDQVASSVVGRSELGVDDSDTLPYIPVGFRDETFMEHAHEIPLPPQISVLETAQWIRGDETSITLPGSVGKLGTEALTLLEETRRAGVVDRFALMSRRQAVADLIEGGFVLDGKHTAKAQALLAGLHRQPALELEGMVHGEVVAGRIWEDGQQATLFLGPTREDVFYGRTDRRYVMRELIGSVPVILAAWTGMRATWTAGVSVDLGEDLLDALFEKSGSVEGSADESPLVQELLVGRWERWSLHSPTTDDGLTWVNTPQRGPAVLERAVDGALRAHQTSPALVYQVVQQMLSDVEVQT